MGIKNFFKTLFGTSEEEKELKKKVEEVMREAKDGITSVTVARAKLEKAQEDFHVRAEEILKEAEDNVKQQNSQPETIPSR
jgi:hypothetical protein